MAITFQTERLTDALWDELLPLLDAHWVEISTDKDIPLVPNRPAYFDAASRGSLRVFTYRDGSELCGYCVFMVGANPHYATSLQAVQDILFIRSDKRGKGWRFIDWCDRQLHAEGVQKSYHHVKLAHDFGAMLERMGYVCVEKIYARRLDLTIGEPPVRVADAVGVSHG